jgi:hypothetical protein
MPKFPFSAIVSRLSYREKNSIHEEVLIEALNSKDTHVKGEGDMRTCDLLLYAHTRTRTREDVRWLSTSDGFEKKNSRAKSDVSAIFLSVLNCVECVQKCSQDKKSQLNLLLQFIDTAVR